METRAGHELAAAADRAVVKCEIFVFGVQFADVALHHGHSPAGWQLVVGEHLQHALVPEVLPLWRTLLQAFLVAQRQVSLETVVEVVADEVLSNLFQDLFVFCLIDNAVEEPMLEGDEGDVFDAQDALSGESGHWFRLLDHAEVRLLVDNEHPQKQVYVLESLLLGGLQLSLELVFGQQVNLGGEAVDADEGGLAVLAPLGFELG